MLIRLLSYVFPSFLATYFVWYILNPIAFNHFCSICFLLVISWTLGYYFFERFNQENINPKNKIVLITGCDTGFGNRLASRLDQLGFHVYAGVLFPDGDGARELKSKCSKRLKVVRMDVTNEVEVKNVVEQLREEKMPLWAIVNNAGIGISAPLEWGNDIEPFQKVFNVNIFGVIRVTKYCIPLLRQSKGRIINVSSAAGRLATPYIGHYCMAKYCVRVFSDTLRRELVNTGIKVVTLEPTFFRTPIINFEQLSKNREKLFNETPEENRQYYGEHFLQMLNNSDGLINMVVRNNIDEVIDSMIKGIIRIHPKLYYRCGWYHELFTIWAVSHLPEILVDSFIKLIVDRRMLRFKAGKYQNKN